MATATLRDTSELNGLLSCSMDKLVKTMPTLSKETSIMRHVDPYIGCPAELVDILGQISDLACCTKKTPKEEVRGYEFFAKAQHLEDQISQVGTKYKNQSCVGLRKSIEAFQTAAWIYLHLACFNLSMEDSGLVARHCRLVGCLSEIVTEGHRTMCPMWPLFIAGCTCSSDEQRAVILDLFLKLETQWPFQNISAIRKGIWTVWQVRDNTQVPTRAAHQDWQETMYNFGWKLSLT